MDIADAQRDVRHVHVGGFQGQLVSGGLWLVSAPAATWGSLLAGVMTLLVGGILIFPVTTVALKVSGGPASLPPGHPMRALAMQIAFTAPLGLLVAVAVAGYRPAWFFPAAMVIVGAHYLPFVFLYGMPLFAVLSTLLTSAQEAAPIASRMGCTIGAVSGSKPATLATGLVGSARANSVA